MYISWKKDFLLEEKEHFTPEGYQSYSKLVAHERYVTKVSREKEVMVEEEELIYQMEKRWEREEMKSVEETVVLITMSEQLHRFLKELEEEEILIMKELYFDDTNLNYCKIAKKLGIPRSTLQSKEKKILNHLRNRFEGEESKGKRKYKK